MHWLQIVFHLFFSIFHPHTCIKYKYFRTYSKEFIRLALRSARSQSYCAIYSIQMYMKTKMKTVTTVNLIFMIKKLENLIIFYFGLLFLYIMNKIKCEIHLNSFAIHIAIFIVVWLPATNNRSKNQRMTFRHDMFCLLLWLRRRFRKRCTKIIWFHNRMNWMAIVSTTNPFETIKLESILYSILCKILMGFFFCFSVFSQRKFIFPFPEDKFTLMDIYTSK